ncbi:Cathepsin_B [Hexamita inflata]|uniref:Cathepsin B n=1 Tax=Hexamita inflata TaxID=28002 RepID=A0AA86PZJ5_9EUKA|nr:Cathepsin B [Hexamita inflata]
MILQFAVNTINNLTKNQMLKYLQNIQNMSWTPQIPYEYRQLDLSETETEETPSTVLTFGQNHGSFSWVNIKLQCMQINAFEADICNKSYISAVVRAFSENRCINNIDETLTYYSTQNMILCDKGNMGCEGGVAFLSLYYLKNVGVPLESCIPFTLQFSRFRYPGKCPEKCVDGSEMIKFKSGEQKHAYRPDESKILEMLQLGVLVTEMDIYEDFAFYQSGIYHHVTAAKIGVKTVTIVGYGVENDLKFWVMRTDGLVGDENGGYFKIVRGTNECNVEQNVYYVS